MAEALAMPPPLPLPFSIDFEFLSQVAVFSCPMLSVPFTISLLSTPPWRVWAFQVKGETGRDELKSVYQRKHYFLYIDFIPFQ